MSAAKMIVQLTTDDLEELVSRAVAKALAKVPSAEREILTRDEVAELLGVNPRVVLRYVEHEGLPASKLGPLWRFKRSDLAAWLDERRVQPGAHAAKDGARLRAVKETG